MIILDPEGLFNGDRLRACSNEAQLHFHRLLLASNGFGRLELNYHRIIGRAYSTFRPPPSEADLNKWIGEYASHHLLFPYTVDGVAWGQWDTNPRLLPRYKSSIDRRSPAPPEQQYIDWKRAYLSERASFPKSFGKVSESFCPVVVVADVVVGAVVDKPNTCASNDARQGVLIPKAPNPQEEWFGFWWDAYWLKKAKKNAWRAFQKLVKTQEQFTIIMAALKAQTPEMLRRDPDKRPYPATWLNGERWQDQTESQAIVIHPKRQDLSSKTLDTMARNLQKYGRIS